MANSRASIDEELTDSLWDLENSLSRVLPNDGPQTDHSIFKVGDYNQLFNKVQHCLHLRRQLGTATTSDSHKLKAQAAKLAKQFDGELMRRMMRAIVETAPAPEVTINEVGLLEEKIGGCARAVSRLYMLITENARLLTGASRRDWWEKELDDRIGRSIAFHQRELNKVLHSDDPPDVRALAIDLLRMEVMHTVLVDLRLYGAASTIQSNMRVTARLTINTASSSIERYIADPDDMNRFDLAIVISAIDDLIVVIRRVIEAQEQSDKIEDMEDLKEKIGTDTTSRFIRNMGVLMLKIFDDLISDADEETLTFSELDLYLRKIKNIHTFCRHVGNLTGADTGGAATKAVITRANKLNKELAGQALEKPDAPQPRECLRALQGFLKSLET
ncbi:MAG: hypothetical protein JJ900_01685 [Rhodospirillales bacterium]|nr:hypothetical protein [Rhodospirillales bacterium]MBO6785533.1 hypothetical protein [Rhodospirillales bacterium]